MIALGAFLKSIIVMDIARFVFGLGGENLAVACNTYASSWFKGEALNMAFGFQLSVVRVGSAVNFIIMKPIYDAFLPKNTTNATDTFLTENATDDDKKNALGWALTIAGLATVLSFIGALVMGILDKRRSKLLGHDLIEQPKVSTMHFVILGR